MHERSLGRILQRLIHLGVEPAEVMLRADVLLTREGGAARVFITAVKALGAWACAGALLFAAFSFRLFDSGAVLMVYGLVAIGLAVLLSRIGRDMFSTNFAAALLAAGQLGLAFSCYKLFPHAWQWRGACLALAGVGLVFYLPVRAHALRIMLAFGPLVAVWGMVSEQHDQMAVTIALGAHLVVLVLLSVAGWRLRLRPVTAASVLSLVLGCGLGAMHIIGGGSYPQMWLALAASVCVGGVWWKRARGGWPHLVAIAALCAAAASLLSLGIQCGMLVVLLGRSLGERWMTLWGLGTLALFAQSFYELRNLTMVHKSLVLLAVGVGLLFLRTLLSHVSQSRDADGRRNGDPETTAGEAAV